MDELNPRQVEFLKNYLDPNSETFSNAYNSATKAGFSEEYAKTIVSRDLEWVSENVNRVNMLRKAERNLDKALDLPLEDEKLGKLNMEATKFVAKGIGKAIYSERTELTGKDGKDLPTPILSCAKE